VRQQDGPVGCSFAQKKNYIQGREKMSQNCNLFVGVIDLSGKLDLIGKLEYAVCWSRGASSGKHLG
jgi:hypothetical protein